MSLWPAWVAYLRTACTTEGGSVSERKPNQTGSSRCTWAPFSQQKDQLTRTQGKTGTVLQTQKRSWYHTSALLSFLALQPGTPSPSPFRSYNKLPLSPTERKKREGTATSHEETHNSLLTTGKETYCVRGFSFKMPTTHTHTHHISFYISIKLKGPSYL